MTASHAQTVEILAADQILRDPAITEAQRLIGNVVLGHEDGVLHCDSAWRYDNGQVDVFSNIRLNQPPSTVLTADFLQLDPESEWASASGQFNCSMKRLRSKPLPLPTNWPVGRHATARGRHSGGWLGRHQPDWNVPRRRAIAAARRGRRGDARTGHPSKRLGALDACGAEVPLHGATEWSAPTLRSPACVAT